MRNQGTDRRSERTRRLLMDALHDLIAVKRYESITVQEITERANVGRSTFYAHFTDKDDLLVDGVRRMVGQLEHDVAGTRNTLAPSLGLFRHVIEGRNLYLTMARGRHLGLFLEALQAELANMFLERLSPRLPQSETVVPPALLGAMVAGMLITAVRTWLESDLSASAEEVNRSFAIAAEAAIRAGLRVRA